MKMFRIFRKKSVLAPPVSTKRVVILVICTILLLVTTTIAWLGISFYRASGKIIAPNIGGGSVLLHQSANSVTPSQLKGEGDGRINIALLGIDEAAGLADSEEILSIDTINHKAAMLSVPRDLWVTIPGYGMNKINAAHSFGERTLKGSGADLQVKTLSQLLDLPIQYYVQLNFNGLQQLVDAVGGVNIVNDNDFTDYEYPNNNFGYLPPQHFAQGQLHLDGTKALIYARSRHSNNAAEGSDFARSKRQQKIILALKQSASQAQVFTNPLKISQVIDILGNNVRTNLQIDEMKQMVSMFKDFDTSQIITKVLDTAADGPLNGGQFDERGYIIIPRDGDYTYKSLQEIAHQIFTDPYLAKENSTIEIRNATGKNGLAATVSTLLKSYGYNVTKVSNSTTKEQFTALIDYSGGKRPFTQSFLERRFNLKARQNSATADIATDFVLILGADYAQTTKALP